MLTTEPGDARKEAFGGLLPVDQQRQFVLSRGLGQARDKPSQVGLSPTNPPRAKIEQADDDLHGCGSSTHASPPGKILALGIGYFIGKLK